MKIKIHEHTCLPYKGGEGNNICIELYETTGSKTKSVLEDNQGFYLWFENNEKTYAVIWHEIKKEIK